MESSLTTIPSRRRQHAPEFKQSLVALCQPGISISGVALAHGVNANPSSCWWAAIASNYDTDKAGTGSGEFAGRHAGQ